MKEAKKKKVTPFCLAQVPRLLPSAPWPVSKVLLALGSYADHSTFCLLSPALFIGRIQDSQVTSPFPFSPPILPVPRSEIASK